MAKTAFKGTPVTLAGEFVKAGTSAPEFTLVKGDLSNYTSCLIPISKHCLP